MNETVTLRDGDTWCELLAIEGGDESIRRAVILGGTYGSVGDRVGLPAELSLEEAGALRAPGRTFVSPFDLFPYGLRPRIERGTLLLDLEDPARGSGEDLADPTSGSSQEFIRLLAQALASDEAENDLGSTPEPGQGVEAA